MGKFSHESHGVADRGGHQTHSDGTPNIARDTKVGKRVTQVPHAFGTTPLQRSGAGVGGLSHPTATIDGGQTIASSAAAAPLQHAYGTAGDLKTGTPAAPPSPGMKSQQNIGIESHADKVRAGKDCLDQAVKC